MKSLLVSLVALSMISFANFAVAKYGMAGCGLGSLLIAENTKMQIVASTTNGTFASQTFGITLGTSNCTDDGVVQADKEREAFVDATKSDLLNNIAAGKGEYLQTLASLYSCNETTVNTFNKVAKDSFTKLAANQSATEILTILEGELNANQVVVSGCAELN